MILLALIIIVIFCLWLFVVTDDRRPMVLHMDVNWYPRGDQLYSVDMDTMEIKNSWIVIGHNKVEGLYQHYAYDVLEVPVNNFPLFTRIWTMFVIICKY